MPDEDNQGTIGLTVDLAEQDLFASAVEEGVVGNLNLGLNRRQLVCGYATICHVGLAGRVDGLEGGHGRWMTEMTQGRMRGLQLIGIDR
jgi:hypothetical protein